MKFISMPVLAVLVRSSRAWLTSNKTPDIHEGVAQVSAEAERDVAQANMHTRAKS